LISIGIFADLLDVVDIGFSNVGENRRGIDTPECSSVSHVGYSSTSHNNNAQQLLWLIPSFHAIFPTQTSCHLINVSHQHCQRLSHLAPLLVLLKLTQKGTRLVNALRVYQPIDIPYD